MPNPFIVTTVLSGQMGTLSNSHSLAANRARAETMGAVRHGPSLLAGLLVCGQCGCRLQVRYGGPRMLHSYTCDRLATT